MPTTRPLDAAITGLIPMAHVADVDRSIRFYSLFGLEVADVLRSQGGVALWSMLRRAGAAIMLARADGPVVAPEQAVLFYLYTRNLNGLREYLVNSGVPDRGPYKGGQNAVSGSGGVWAVSTPHYMPLGEMRVEDPDGYTLLVGQLERDGASA